MVKPYERERRRRAKERSEEYEFSTGTKLAVFVRAGGYCEQVMYAKATNITT